MIIRKLVALLTALGVAFAGAFLLGEPAQAATGKITVGKVSTGNGTITTPKVSDHGAAKITKKTYRISRSGKTIARTSKAGKTYRVTTGTYKVKTVVRYRVGSKKRTYTKTRTVKVTKNSAIMTGSEYNRIKKGLTRTQVANIVGSAGKLWECDITGACAVFFRSTGYKRIVVVSFKSGKVIGKGSYPGDRMDAYYDALFG